MRAIDNRLKRLEGGRADGGFFFRWTVYESKEGGVESAYVTASLIGHRGQALHSSDFPTLQSFVAALGKACRTALGRELTNAEKASASAASFQATNTATANTKG